MSTNLLLAPILVPLIAGILVLFIRQRAGFLKEAIALLATGFTLYIAIAWYNHQMVCTLPWAGFGMEFILRLYHFSSFILLAASGFSFLIVLYSCSFMRAKEHLNQFYAYLLITVAMVNGAVLADNLVLMLFFWEGTLLTLFGMIAIGGKQAFKSATKAFILVGISDLCMMIGIGMTGYLAGTMTMSKISLAMTSMASFAFIFIMIGAISKAGSMPFHSWIPDAAVDAPLPFMAFLPASLEKLMGIYLLARISLNLFQLSEHSWISMVMMIVGSITILVAVMMALIQKDYKRLLSYHAISQVGYMVLGIGTCLPIGIIGGLFHMINHAMYKSCLFLTGGSVEKQSGTTGLEKLGGLAAKMPITFTCFFIAAASISGVPPLNGFYSKELVYEGALERSPIFYVAAMLGTFFTAASFLKLGHAAYLGKRSEMNRTVKEASWPMLLPMIVIAGFCVFFGLNYSWPLNNLISPILGQSFKFESNMMLIVVTCIVLLLALAHHLFAVKLSGSGLKASEHIRHAPMLEQTYNMAEQRYFDPYDLILALINGMAKVLWWIDRGIDWLYNGLSVWIVSVFSAGIRKAHTGSYSMYVIWSLVGAVLIIVYFLKF